MFDNKFDNNQSQAVQGGSDAAYTENNNGQSKGAFSGMNGQDGNHSGEGAGQGSYSSQSGNTGQSSYNSQSGSAGQSNYSSQSGSTGQSSYGSQSGNVGQSSYNGQNGSAGQNSYSSQANAGQGNYSGQNYYGRSGGMNQGGYNSQVGGTQNYGGYGSYQSHQGNYQYGTGDYGNAAGGSQKQARKAKEKKAKKPMNPFWKKAVAVVVSGVCFGVCAGVSFLAVSSLGGIKETVTVSQSTEAASQTAEAASQTAETAESAQAENNSGIKSTVVQGTTSAVVTDVTEVVEATMPSIVSITNQSIVSGTNFWGQTYEQEQASAGSGIIIGENETELLIVTNNHVVADSNKLYVKFIDDEVVEAQIKGTNPSMDLAVVAVKLENVESSTKDSISIATMGDSDSLKVGEPVIAIGNALGYGQSVTTGVVSALNRTLEVSETGTSNALIQTDAAINPGNSGGALLDIKGQVIGINSNKIGGNAVEGMGYAIPISSAQPIIEELMNRETRERVEEANRGYLGISCINVTSAMAEAYGMPEGILIAQVYPATGADNAGLVKGDVIVGFAGATVSTQDDLTNAMQYYAVGDTVEITIMRGNLTDGYEEQTVSVTLTSQEAMNAANK